MVEKRKNFRYKTLAKARIEGISEKESILRDLSITGCLIECQNNDGIECNKQYNLEIIPESDADVGKFPLAAEVKWTSAEDASPGGCEIGFRITYSPKGKLFKRYVDYLAWRYSQGSSMTGISFMDIPPELKL